MRKNKAQINQEKWAIVTGASKGIGYGYCKKLLDLGWNVVAVARNTDSLDKLSKEYTQQIVLKINLDLSDPKNSYKLFEDTKNMPISLIINNAGRGVLGDFDKADLEQELNMIDLNIKSLHILTKLFTQRFSENEIGRIINIASVVAFLPGPGFASYYASKAYVQSLGSAINHELKTKKSKSRVITICPGPLKTGFTQRSRNELENKTEFTSQSKDVTNFVNISLKKALKAKRRNYFIIGFRNRFLNKLMMFIPKSWSMNAVYRYNRKNNK
ncbi:SDR family NAD(P)-dependent oxidoreductase [Spiroplasma alleghenense]|uniref:Short-chain dehydrogenase/reductase SDR n=1 Tax=Spiroplasma alleghenense TaxID=216931 RepID=A0A345Z444_9MOLU|nr:SDR family NAD(P)-dependent oxidoreductase [Spiroplasma alleghenense]AXK51373.1 short-chain dehydrogenase/reductase SDR [Spiroplasma alleghenense]